MAGSTKLRKQLRDVLLLEVQKVKDAIFSGDLTVKEADIAKIRFRAMLPQFLDLSNCCREPLEIWKDGEKIAKLDKDTLGIQEQVELTLESLDRYIDLSKNTMADLSQKVERSLKEEESMSKTVVDTMITSVKKPAGISDETVEKLAEEMKSMRIAHERIEHKIDTHITPKTRLEGYSEGTKGKVHTLVKKIEFDSGLMAKDMSTPLRPLDLREDDRDPRVSGRSGLPSEHLYMNDTLSDSFTDDGFDSLGSRRKEERDHKYSEYQDSLTEYVKTKRPPLPPKPERTTDRSLLGLPRDDTTKYLTKIPIGKFDGDKRKFESWWAAWMACVDAADVSDKVKLLKLYDCLGKDPLDTVSDLGFTDISYTVAKEKLVRKYGGQRRRLAIRYDELTEFRPMKDENPEDFERFAELLDRLVINLHEQHETAELGAGTLYHTIQRKMPSTSLQKYERWLFENRKHGDVMLLREFVNQEALFLITASEAVRGFAVKRKGVKGSTGGTGRTMATGSMNAGMKGNEFGNRKKIKCKVCPAEHNLWECAKYLNMDIDKRKEKVRELSVCSKCLQYSHKADKCYRKKGCTVQGCTQKHHYTLHESRTGGSDKREASSQGQYSGQRRMIPGQGLSNQASRADNKSQTMQEKGAVTVDTGVGTDDLQSHTSKAYTHLSQERAKKLASIVFRTVPIILRNGHRHIKVNALMDDASNRSYISEAVAGLLRLQGEQSMLKVKSINDTETWVHSLEVSCELQSLDEKTSLVFFANVIPQISQGLTADNMNLVKEHWSHLRDIEFPTIEDSVIDVLIGLDFAWLMSSCPGMGDITGEIGDPIARLTPLGWTCIGSVGHVEKEGLCNVAHTFTTTSDVQLGALVRKFWEVESVTETKITKPDDKRALQLAETTITYQNGRYMIGVPWKEGRPQNCNNYDMAVKSWKSTEKRLLREPDVYLSYSDIIKEYLEKGYIRRIPRWLIRTANALYLSHFPIVRAHVETTKTRIVYNASAEYLGISLNSFILTGPKLQKDLVVVLLRFRRYAVALCSDIQQMYLQIFLLPEDRPYHRFVYRDCTKEVQEEAYEFTRLVFGVNASPFLAQFVAQKHAEKFEKTHPSGADTIKNSTYMDDGHDSSPDDTSAIQKYREVKHIWNEAGMTVHKWLSNSEVVMKEIPLEERGSKVDLTKSELPQAKALGVGWNAKTDDLCIASSIDIILQIQTKREYLKRLAGMYDPLGLLSPLLIRGKILLQKCWESGKDWDEPLPQELCRQIRYWFEDIRDVDSLTVPRVLVKYVDGHLELHVCSDASGDAYGSVVYVMNISVLGVVWINLALSKAKVAPLAHQSIPRLELMAGVVGVHIAAPVRQVLEVPLERCYFWTDSQDVLYWVMGHSREYKPFIANRVGEIQRESEPQNWRYIPTDYNPADLLSRGMETDKLKDSDLWWKGPDFWIKPMDEWPQWDLHLREPVVSEKKRASVVTFTAMVKDTKVELIKDGMHLENSKLNPANFSCWHRLVHVFAYVLRFVAKVSAKVGESGKILTVEEIIHAERVLIAYSQRQTYRTEFKLATRGQVMPGTSELKEVSPWIDENGLLRGNTRLSESKEVPWDVRFPLLLSRKHWIAFLIAREAHVRLLHAGAGTVVTDVQQRFWIVGLRLLVNSVKKECMVCRRLSARPIQPVMAPLPDSRLDKSGTAFAHVSTDFAGPFMTKAGRGRARNKRYMCLYTCIHTRAIHLELVYDMGAQGFLMSLTRFVARRGVPDAVYSDHGSNYKAASREMKEFYDELKEEEIREGSKQDRKCHKIVWHFRPPAAPHFNGIHETMVKAAKRAIYAILSPADVTDEELATAFCDAEAMLNSRPITVCRSDPRDLQPLTPQHFLVGRMTLPLPYECKSFEDEIKERWRYVQRLLGDVWRRWMREWVTGLTPRTKWLREGRNLRVGDVVLLIDPATHRKRWNLGKILQVFPGPDGVVRVVDVQIGPTVYRRPAVKLSLLVACDE